jgi:CRP-like cAMP-binding protein
MSSPEENDNHCSSCEFQDNISLLRETGFFGALPLESLKVLAYLCTREVYKPGDFLYQQGDEDGCAFYIISGSARLILETQSGRSDIREYAAGTLLGTLSLVGHTRRLFSLQAVDDLYVMLLEREKFMKGIAPFPETIPKIFQSLANTIVSWEEQFLGSHDGSCGACTDKIGVSVL